MSLGCSPVGLSPRESGEPRQVVFASSQIQAGGLSPRVRGNHRPCGLQHITTVYPRVCGGTLRRMPALSGRAVYPRVCGGTHPVQRFRKRASTGLSPRVRGNPDAGMINQATSRGSIPACAGEPNVQDWLKATTSAEGLSPRVRGNHLTSLNCSGLTGGLSPRVRGNRRACAVGLPYEGEVGLSPRVRGNHVGVLEEELRFLLRVYPRVCGGTSAAQDHRPHSTARSIPACAGEPNSNQADVVL